MIDKFNNQADYRSFLAWKYEGSCLAQRMATSAPGGRFDIPEHWQRFNGIERDWPLDLPGFLDASRAIGGT